MRRMYRDKRRGSGPLIGRDENEPIVRYWCARLVGLLDSQEVRISRKRTNEIEEWARLHVLGQQPEEHTSGEKQSALKAWAQQELECRGGGGAPERGQVLDANLSALASILGLTPVETDLLGFIALAKTNPALRDALDALGDTTLPTVTEVAAHLIGHDTASVREALRYTSALPASGLLTVDSDGPWMLSYFEMPCGLDNELLLPQDDVMSLLRELVSLAAAPALELADFDYMAADLAILSGYLERALSSKHPGVNVLLYGPPGTGKTQLARALAASLQASLYELGHTNSVGKSFNSHERFRAYQLAQHALARQPRAMVLFDEIEDVFPKYFRFADKDDLLKAWINRQLEHNPVPAVWISNEVWQIDTAYRRRFDYVLEMLPPPRSVRARMLRRAFAETEVSPEWIESAAGNEQLQLGHLERAIRIGKAAGGEHAASLEPVLERVLGNLVHALDEKPPRWGRHAARTPYRLDTVNADFDLQRLAQGLQQSRRGTLCLYGPPGTGKTAFGDHLAARLDLPVIRRRASDLLSAWLGETEAKIARMFREAERSGAMVLLDEADSFLRSRETASHSWEVTQVNELLVQMESFTGLFIATTNHFGSTDPASLRRFDFKIRFDYPTPEQSWELFQCVIKRQRVAYDVDESLLRERLAKLDNLAPGDFATVIRQSAILGEALTATTFLGRLAKECAIKPDAPRPGIGFTVQ